MTKPLLGAPAAAALAAELLDGSSADVQAARCESLLNFSQLTADAPARVLACALVCVLQRHTEHARVQLFACSALGNAVSPHRADAAAVCADAVAAGAIEAVVAALRAFPTYHQIQFVALGVLLKLMALDPARQARAAAAGANTAAIDALKLHAHDVEITVYACNVLSNATCDHAANAATAAADGALQAVIAAMGAHSGVEEMQRVGCCALHNLTCSNDTPANRQIALDAGAAQATMHALTCHR
jgi:hypothetical protein